MKDLLIAVNETVCMILWALVLIIGIGLDSTSNMPAIIIGILLIPLGLTTYICYLTEYGKED